jgi:AcrR family transcriptional regulator
MTNGKRASRAADDKPSPPKASSKAQEIAENNVPSGKRPVQLRDAEGTRSKILDAATVEFSRLGLGGARVDAIAKRAKVNKRMIYHYFGSKDNLFLVVVENAYAGIRGGEQQLRLDHLAPKKAIRELMTFTWNYYLKHPEFLYLVNSENLHKARHVKKSLMFKSLHTQFVKMLSDLLDRGVKEGVFRKGIEPVQLHISMASVAYYYLTNRHTGSVIYEMDLMDPAALQRRLEFNIETVLRMICVDVSPDRYRRSLSEEPIAQ